VDLRVGLNDMEKILDRTRATLHRLEGSCKLKKFNNLMGNQIRGLPACSIVPQPTTLPRAPLYCDTLPKKPAYSEARCWVTKQ
jgi:hypothetical protein